MFRSGVSGNVENAGNNNSGIIGDNATVVSNIFCCTLHLLTVKKGTLNSGRSTTYGNFHDGSVRQQFGGRCFRSLLFLSNNYTGPVDRGDKYSGAFNDSAVGGRGNVNQISNNDNARRGKNCVFKVDIQHNDLFRRPETIYIYARNRTP